MDDDNTINTTYKARHKNCVRARPKNGRNSFLLYGGQRDPTVHAFSFAQKQKVRRSNLVFVEFLTKGGAR
jgi:hypothetical protein